MEEKTERFEYTYSAVQQEEIEKIRAKYVPQRDNKLEQLRRLDASVTKKGTIAALILGIIGCLVFGGGMSIVLVAGTELLVPGALIGVLGMILMVFAYPVYKKTTEKERERITPQILALTEELACRK